MNFTSHHKGMGLVYLYYYNKKIGFRKLIFTKRILDIDWLRIYLAAPRLTLLDAGRDARL